MKKMTNRPWMLLCNGNRFFPDLPKPKDIDINVIAHSLSQINRFGGHTKKPYCPAESQRILMDNLQWVPAGDLEEGDYLVGFDENPTEVGMAGNRHRMLRPSQVTAVGRIKRKIVRLELSDGSSVRASIEHPWLIANKASGNQKWETSWGIQNALQENRTRHLHKFMNPWGRSRLSEYSRGWLAGIADGEGYFSHVNKGIRWGITQKTGLVYDEIHRLLSKTGVGSVIDYGAGRGTYHDVHSVSLSGGWRTAFEFLGTIQPIRLLDKFQQDFRAEKLTKTLQTQGPNLLKVEKAFLEDDEWVVGLETSTHTYFCEGFAAHNSVAQHSWMVSRLLQELGTSESTQLIGLLHDAAEAFIGDITRPIKHLWVNYSDIEQPLTQMIYKKFGLPPTPYGGILQFADDTLLVTERRDLMPRCRFKWPVEKLVKPLPRKIIPISSRKAEDMFLNRFHQLYDPY